MKMKTFLKTNALAIMALLFAGSIMSFKIAEDNADSTTYFYNSEDVSTGAFANVSHWQTTNASECENYGDRPCSIVVPDGQTLSGVLAGKNNVQVLSMSPNRKP